MKRWVLISLAVFGGCTVVWEGDGPCEVSGRVYEYRYEFAEKADSAVFVRLRERVETVYPLLVERFRPTASGLVIVRFDSSLSVVYHDRQVSVTAATNYLSGRVTVRPQWFLEHAGEYDVAVHELFHLIQGEDYFGVAPWWSEGLADAVRWEYRKWESGVFTLPKPGVGSSYRDSYQVTAGFIVWLDGRYGGGVVDTLFARQKSRSLTEGFWVERYGKSVDELWGEYVSSAE